jgi:ABC-type sugar transport system permease subunit
MLTLVRSSSRHRLVLAMMLLPSLPLTGIVSYYPAVRSLVGGFCQWNGFTRRPTTALPSSSSTSSWPRSSIGFLKRFKGALSAYSMASS